jgi:uncharacterized protein
LLNKSEQKNIKIVLDTNIWISFLIGKKLSSLVTAIAESAVEIFLSDKLLNEITKVLKYPRLEHRVSEAKLHKLFKIFKNEIKKIQPACSISDCRDAKDNFLLELAVSANADYLVTGDSDLLVLNPYRGIKIIKAHELERILIQPSDNKKMESENTHN